MAICLDINGILTLENYKLTHTNRSMYRIRIKETLPLIIQKQYHLQEKQRECPRKEIKRMPDNDITCKSEGAHNSSLLVVPKKAG